MISIKKFATSLAMMAAVVLIVPGSALAASATVSGNVTGGNLSITTTASPSFSATLDGTDQTKSYTVPTTVTDARGNNAGWRLQATSTQFSTGGANPSTLDTNASTITGVTNSCASGSTCTNPTNSAVYPIGLPAGSPAPTPVTYFNAATSTGKGKFTNTPAVDVFLPANVDAGSYSSTLTLTAASGPS